MRKGGAWEAQLERLHDRYRRDRLAAIWRVHPPVIVRAARADRTFVGAWAGDGPPDFSGVLYANGRAILFDAKDCAARRWPLKDLQRHQARDLEAAHIAGGLAFVALRIRGEAIALPWAELGPVYWSWREGAEGAPASVAGTEPWVRPFDVAGDGWLPVFAG